MPTLPIRTPLAILAIDDSPAHIYLLRRMLDTQGFPYTLEVIEDGEHALRFFDQLAQQEHVPCPDILLLDLHLPRHHGKGLLQRFKAIPRCVGTAVVVVTASVDPAERREMLALGADAFFPKPASLEAYMELGYIIQTFAFGVLKEEESESRRRGRE